MSDLPPPPGSIPPPPPGMGAPQPGQPYGGPPAAAPSNGVGTVALVMGILQFLCLGIIGSVLAIILGKIGMSKADRGEATNKGVAKAGFILGIIGLILNILVLIGVVIFLANAPKIVDAACRAPFQLAAPNTTLTGCSVAGEDFTGRTYTGWNVSGTNMSATNFSDTSWTDTTFDGSNLANANFTGCRMTGVTFTGTDLVGANFSRCEFENVTLRGSSYDDSTVFPEGFNP